MADVDFVELEAKVRQVYRQVAEQPHATYHFEMGRALAQRLGYPDDLLTSIPESAVESFAGVGYFFDLADLQPGEAVIDLGSGSGMDTLIAARLVGPAGRVVGVDFTLEQLTKARRLAAQVSVDQVEFRAGRIDRLPADSESFDCAISNGVINLSPDKQRVFAEAARVLRPGGRLAIADIVTTQQLTEAIVSNADLWASCIGGAAQQDAYRDLIEAAGLTIKATRVNLYEFLSRQARNASVKYGVHSISLLAVKSGR
jgi:ubiquinone/menaquinone biosynthesis C-methylase UbiE